MTACSPIKMTAPAGCRDGSTIIALSRAPLGRDGRLGDFALDASASRLYGPKTAAGWGAPLDLRGPAGWRPAFAATLDGARRVLRVTWAGGAGVPPASGYLGAAGLVDAIADAVDLRGAPGTVQTVSDAVQPMDAVPLSQMQQAIAAEHEAAAIGTVAWTHTSAGLNASVAAAIGAAKEERSKVVRFLPGTYSMTSPVLLGPAQSGLHLVGVPGQTVLQADALTYLVKADGVIDTGLGAMLAADAAAGSMAITLASGKGLLFATGWHFLISQAYAVGNSAGSSLANQRQGEFVFVERVQGDLLTLASPLLYDCLVTDAAQLFRMTPARNITLENIIFKSSDPYGSFRRIFTAFSACLGLRMINCHFEDGAGSGVMLSNCIGASVDVSARNLLSDPVQPGSYGYAVCEAGANVGASVRVRAERTRHAYTTVTGTGAPQPANYADLFNASNYGVPTLTRVEGTAIQPRAAGFDTHPGAGDGVTFVDPVVIGGRSHAIQLRAVRDTVLGGMVRQSVGPAAFATSTAIKMRVEGLRATMTNLGVDDQATDWRERGAIYLNGAGAVIVDADIEDCGGPAIEIVSGAARDIEIVTPRVRNPCRKQVSSIRAGVLSSLNAATRVAVKGGSVICDDARMDYGVYQTGASLTLSVSLDSIVGSQTQPVYAEAAKGDVAGRFGTSRLNGGKAIVATIVAGALTITNLDASSIAVGGEGGAADDLDSIVGGLDGDILELRGNGQTITVRHAASGGNIYNQTGAAATISGSFARLRMQKRGASWVVLG